MVVPFPPGGAADFPGRVMGERMARGLGQPVTVENRSGAGGNIGTAAALAAERDGHTLLLNGVPIAVNRFLFATLPFDPDRDVTPLSMIAVVPNIMVVPNALPANSVAEFVALARTRRMTYASIGNGTSLHLAGAQFALAAGVELEHVPYRETSAANNDVMAGRVDVMFQTIAAAAELVRGGRMKALAVTSAERARASTRCPRCAGRGWTSSPSAGSGCSSARACRPRGRRCWSAKPWRPRRTRRCARAPPQAAACRARSARRSSAASCVRRWSGSARWCARRGSGRIERDGGRRVARCSHTEARNELKRPRRAT